MRILLLTSDFTPAPWSGIGVAVARQAHALARAGLDVHVVVADDQRQTPLVTGKLARGLTVHSLGRRRFPLNPNDFDWVHLHSLRLAGLAQELRRRFALPLAYTVHGFPDLELGNSALTRAWSALQRTLILNCDRVVYLSRAERRHGLARAGAGGARHCIVPNGVLPPTGEDRAVASRGPIVFAGRFTLAKGVDLLARTIRRLGPRQASDVVIAGGHGDRPGTRVMVDLVAQCRGRCKFTGWLNRARLDDLYARASLVIVPSRYEPFGLVALEAMRVGAPVLAADTGGLADVVETGWGGVRVASRHPDDWAHAVIGLRGADASTLELSRRGRQRVHERFSIDAVATRLVESVYAG